MGRGSAHSCAPVGHTTLSLFDYITLFVDIVNRRKKRSSDDRDVATMTNSAEYYSHIASASPDNRRDSDMSTGTYLNDYMDIHVYTQLDVIADSSV